MTGRGGRVGVQARFPRFHEGPGEGRGLEAHLPDPEAGQSSHTHTRELKSSQAIGWPLLSLNISLSFWPSTGFLMESFGHGSADEELGRTCLEGSRCGGGRPEEDGN